MPGSTTYSKTFICNLAIRALAISQTIENVDTDRSPEAFACKDQYDQTVVEVLRAFPWPFATQIVQLALVANQPNVEWLYSYRVPSDSVRVRRILNGLSRIESHENRIPYRLARDSQGALLFCDLPGPPYVEYTQEIDDPTEFPPDFVRALGFKLAYNIAPSVTAGDPFKLGDKAFKLYGQALEEARDNAINEEQPDDLPDADLIRFRDEDLTGFGTDPGPFGLF